MPSRIDRDHVHVVDRLLGVSGGQPGKPAHETRPLQFEDLWNICNETPGHADDKLKAVLLKAVLLRVSQLLVGTKIRGIVFAYDEAQNLADHALDKQYPLSVLLDVFSWIQRQRLPCQFLLTLTGLPTLFPKLNAARTYTERMFHVLTLEGLDLIDAHAVVIPIEITQSPLTFSEVVISQIIKESGGYPYFIQFICKEVFDAWITKVQKDEAPSVPVAEIIAKLDQDFFSSRWQNATTRQQDFMRAIATLSSSEGEFTVQEIVQASKNILRKSFSASHANQMLSDLIDAGLIYKSRRGGYRFAVPLLSGFINRQLWDPASLRTRASSSSAT